MDPRFSLTQTTVNKTNTRFASENSFRASVCLLMLIAVTHFIEIPEEDFDVRTELKNLPADTRQLYDLVTDALGGIPVDPIEPSLNNSTDDTTQYIFEGAKKAGIL